VQAVELGGRSREDAEAIDVGTGTGKTVRGRTDDP